MMKAITFEEENKLEFRIGRLRPFWNKKYIHIHNSQTHIKNYATKRIETFAAKVAVLIMEVKPILYKVGMICLFVCFPQEHPLIL